MYEKLALLMLRIDGGLRGRSGAILERIDDLSGLAVRGREKDIGRGRVEMGGRAVTSGAVVALGMSWGVDFGLSSKSLGAEA